VFVVEGEKAADRLVSEGFVATCGSGGAGKWHHTEREHFRGAKIAVVPDNDDPGRMHALDVARSLVGLASVVRVVELPDLPAKADAHDWLKRGHTAAELRKLVTGAPEFTSVDVAHADEPSAPKTRDAQRRRRRLKPGSATAV
jgi:DNA primase